MTGDRRHGAWREIADRVFVRRYEWLDQEIGLVVGDGAALLIDTRATLRHGREVRDEARLVTDAPISVVVNTHGHWDHCFGNAVFRGAAFWAQSGVVRFIADTAEAARARLTIEMPELAADFREVALVVPSHLVEERASLDVGGRRVELAFHGRGHTDHDLVLTVSDAAVTFAGDLVEEGNAPYFGDGYPLEWPETLDLLLAAAPDGRIVPGHGDVVDRAFVGRQRGEIAAMIAAAVRVQAEALPIDEIIGDVPFPEPAARDAIARTLAQLRGELD